MRTRYYERTATVRRLPTTYERDEWRAGAAGRAINLLLLGCTTLLVVAAVLGL